MLRMPSGTLLLHYDLGMDAIRQLSVGISNIQCCPCAYLGQRCGSPAGCAGFCVSRFASSSSVDFAEQLN